jgi:thiol-disulfide isomerase/thioredoxin
MKKLYKLVIILLFAAVKSLSAQSQESAVNQLKIGDKIPEELIANFLNLPGKSVKTHDLYKNGLLLIDFWATWCGPCIAEMGRLDSLKLKYRDSLSVVCIDYEPEKTVQNYFLHHKEIHVDHLLITTGDTLFVHRFPHQAIPHNIWIDSRGIIRAITSSDEITDEHLHEFLVNKEYNLRLKSDMIFDIYKPLHIEDSLIQYRSIFNTHLNGVNISGATVSAPGYGKKQMNRFFVFNGGIIGLFWDAYADKTGGGVPNPELYEIHTKDSIRYFWPEENMSLFKRSKYKTRQNWVDSNTYFYDLRLPHPVKDSVFYSWVQNDLSRILNIRSWIEYKMVDCMVVKKHSVIEDIARADQRAPEISVEKDVLNVKNATIDDLMNWITQNTISVQQGKAVKGRLEPYINQTGINYPVNMTMDLSGDFKGTDLELIENRLAKYGFTFKKKKYPHAVLVIDDIQK